VGADEPLTNREILGKFDEVRRGQKATDDRVAELANKTVSAEVWARENGHMAKDIAEVDAHCEERHKITMRALGDMKDAMGELKKFTQDSLKELKSSGEQQIKDLRISLDKKSEFTWTRVLMIVGILATLAAAWYSALHPGGH